MRPGASGEYYCWFECCIDECRTAKRSEPAHAPALSRWNLPRQLRAATCTLPRQPVRRVKTAPCFFKRLVSPLSLAPDHRNAGVLRCDIRRRRRCETDAPLSRKRAPQQIAWLGNTPRRQASLHGRTSGSGTRSLAEWSIPHTGDDGERGFEAKTYLLSAPDKAEERPSIASPAVLRINTESGGQCTFLVCSVGVDRRAGASSIFTFPVCSLQRRH